MRTSTRIAAVVTSLAVTTALLAVPAQADDAAGPTAVQATESSASAVGAKAASSVKHLRKCTPSTNKRAQVRTCMYLHKDGPKFSGEAMVTDIRGGRNYSVMAYELRVQAYAGGRWHLVANTWKADKDGWFDKRDYAKHGRWATCHGAGQTVPLRAVAKVKYKLKSGGGTKTVTRTSPSARFWCP